MCKKISIMSLLIFILAFLLTPIPQSFSQTTNLYIDPQLTITQIGETFSINISIAQVTNLAAWEIKLYYLNTILNGTKATEGSFLKTAGPTFFWVVSFTDNYNATHGRIHITCTLTGTGPGATGSGTLTTITFKAKNGGNTPLTLTDTKLLDNQDPPQQIPHTITNGNVQVKGIHDIAVFNVKPLKTIVGQGYTMNINVTVANQGDQTETFNLTLYANTTTIETKTITIANRTSKTITLTWNTAGFAKGNYTIRAYAWPVQGETDMSDNTCGASMSVHVGVAGDVSGETLGVYDGICNMRDVTYLIMLFQTEPNSPNWNPNADINNDGIVNMRDITIAVLNFNKSEL